MTERGLQLLEEYKREYSRLTFEDKQRIMKEIIDIFPQHLYAPNKAWVLSCLERIAQPNKELKILELGTYSGELALSALERHPGFSWTGYDIARVEPIEDLKVFQFTLNELNEEFYLASLDDDYDVFITSDTLEHLLWTEVRDIFKKTSDIEYQIHVVDFTLGEKDTHLLHASQSEFIATFENCFDCLRCEILINPQMGRLGPYVGRIPVRICDVLRRLSPVFRRKVFTNRMGFLGRARMAFQGDVPTLEDHLSCL